jgi:hypothetical protein
MVENLLVFQARMDATLEKSFQGTLMLTEFSLNGAPFLVQALSLQPLIDSNGPSRMHSNTSSTQGKINRQS